MRKGDGGMKEVIPSSGRKGGRKERGGAGFG